MKKKTYIIIGAVIVAVLLAWMFMGGKKETTVTYVTAEAKTGAA